jgi:hypothetical protein
LVTPYIYSSFFIFLTFDGRIIRHFTVLLAKFEKVSYLCKHERKKKYETSIDIPPLIRIYYGFRPEAHGDELVAQWSQNQ